MIFIPQLEHVDGMISDGASFIVAVIVTCVL